MSGWDNLLKLANQSCLATFGIQATYRPALRNHPELAEHPIMVTGIFEERNADLTVMGAGENGLDVIVPQTTLELRLSDLGFLPMAGDEVIVGGLLYRIVEVRPDGRGMVVSSLTRLSDW
ncbi:MAG: hypothetical protein H7838_12740 [Magnetococcus sp. DMHC-8]